MIYYIWIFYLLILFHFIADYPLQGDFLSKAKNKNTDVGKLFWIHALTAHSFIHSGFVSIVTGNLFLGLFEFVSHFITDYLKCQNKITLNQDQFIHILSKLLWVILFYVFDKINF